MTPVAVYVVTFGTTRGATGDYTRPVCFPERAAANDEALRFMANEGSGFEWREDPAEPERYPHVEKAWTESNGMTTVWLERLPVEDVK